MKRTARDNRPALRPVKKIEVPEKHLLLRIILFVVLLVFGASALIYGLSGLFAKQSGWQRVTTESKGAADCGDEFELQYEFGKSDVSVRAESNQLTRLYSEASVTAYQLFHETQEFDGVCNVAYLNAHPNQSVEVDPVLYHALESLSTADTRQPYLAPLYDYYNNLFLCTEDYETQDYDPAQNKELAALFAEILDYANDPDAIDLELEGNNKVCLRVSDAYLQFAGETEIYTFYSFHWMKNAFIADYLASTLIENGYTHGTLSSFDGFYRDLDDRGTLYSLNLFDRVENTICLVGAMNYTEPLSIVSLRTFPVNPADNPRYYVLENKEVRFPYLDPSDGLCRAGESNLVCYSDSAGCAEILLRMLPVYIADSFDPMPLVKDPKIDVLFCRDQTIWHSAESLDVTSALPAKEEYVCKQLPDSND